MLDVRSVSVYYGKVQAVAGISVYVNEGEIVAVLGANGAGKTTLLRAISGLQRPDFGEISFGNLRIDRLSPADIVRAGIIHVPEGRKLFPDMSVMDNLIMGAYLRKDKAGISRDLEIVFDLFPVLKTRAGSPARTLSGGEQQMLSIGRGLMAKPKVLMLDEYSLGLAPIVTEQIGEAIKTINRSGVGVLLVEQHTHLALSLASRGYVIETGRVVLEGQSAELHNSELVKDAYLGD